MKRHSAQLLLILYACLQLTPVFAEYTINDKSEILGVWQVDSEAAKLDGPKRALQQQWEFKSDGSLISQAKDRRGNADVRLKYSIENGKIVKEIRPGKNETCTVIDKTNNKMTLYCRNLYFFLTKK